MPRNLTIVNNQYRELFAASLQQPEQSILPECCLLLLVVQHATDSEISPPASSTTVSACICSAGGQLLCTCLSLSLSLSLCLFFFIAYFSGKMLAKMGRIALIAEEMGRPDDARMVAARLAEASQVWLCAVRTLFVYFFSLRETGEETNVFSQSTWVLRSGSVVHQPGH